MPQFICPTCGHRLTVSHRREAPFRPFCCERCKLLDLGKWFNEEYRIEIPLPAPDDQPARPAD